MSRLAFLLAAGSAGFRETKLPFVLENSASPEKYLPETMAGGVAAFDYNNDGLPNIFFANGVGLPSLKKTAAKYSNRLFRNDGNGRFTDVTAEANLAGSGYSIGVAAADFDKRRPSRSFRREPCRVVGGQESGVQRPRSKVSRVLPSAPVRGIGQYAIPESRRRHVRKRFRKIRYR
ncbi:MAG: VCBS repeat-containing protein [Acidobacteriota bacterium]|nr:VCBS repeat-containing protein [Acidobacteriota bacterium]